ncbi:MAG: VWA domain-containing protein, partial [Verrucomicrobiales bacterium]|nr:VWA domain-containing protein [Verrucomicrobiales bacterium]
MKKLADTKKTTNAFSMVEVMIVLAVISILALISVATITKVKPAAEISKLRSDVQSLNTAVKIYKHSGGDLNATNSPAEVIAKLKTVRQKSTSQSFVGYTGSMLDTRLSITMVNSNFKGPRAVYDKDKERFFVTTDPVEGFRFDLLDLNSPEVNALEETRAQSALEYANTSSWVWDYEDVAPPERLDPTLITRMDVPTPDPGSPGAVSMPTGPEEPELHKLLPPTFSRPSDYYPLAEFPLSITIGNPNDTGLSKIVYGIINAPNWEWLDYTGPVSVAPGDKVLAFVESLKPREFHHSDPADEHYNWNTTLAAPQITAAPDQYDARTGSTSVTIYHDNNPDYFEFNGQQLSLPPNAFSVEYKLVPLVPGQGMETAWNTYQNPFDVGGPQFPRGFQVVAKVVSHSPHFTDSGEATQPVDAYYTLEPPVINSSVDVLESSTETAIITITNPNTSGSDQIVYRILDDHGAAATGWLDYTSPVPVSAIEFPRGFTIVAKALPSESYYRESAEASKTVAVHFFGIEVTGKTIFILDSSGSMSTNDRIGRLKNATIAVLNVLDSNDSFALVDYDSNATTLLGWGAG